MNKHSNNSQNLIIINLVIAILILSIAQLSTVYRLVIFRVGISIVFFTIVYIIFSTENSLKIALIKFFSVIKRFSVMEAVNNLKEILLRSVVITFSLLRQGVYDVASFSKALIGRIISILQSMAGLLMSGLRFVRSRNYIRLLDLPIGLFASFAQKIRKLFTNRKQKPKAEATQSVDKKIHKQEPIITTAEEKIPSLRRHLIGFAIWLVVIGFYVVSFLRLINANTGITMFYFWQGLN